MRFFLTQREKVEKFGIFRGNLISKPKPKIADPTQTAKN